MPTCDSCVLCNQPLVVLPKVASLRLAGMKGVAIKTAKVASKQCTNVDCKAVHNLVCHSPPLIVISNKSVKQKMTTYKKMPRRIKIF